MSATSSHSLLADYRPLAARADELLGGDNRVRGAWRYLSDAIEALGMTALQQRRDEAQRLLRERGVTYNVYGDPAGAERPWELDPIPVPIDSDEWARVETGLHRRAELLNLVLKDLYGPQELIRRGILPLSLVLGHPGFLRPCHPYPPERPYPLTLYAADLARGPDGRFRVISDRTQVPTGAGYALQNRLIMTRILPSLFRDSRVHRLAGFFQQMRLALAESALDCDDREPRVVVLTPGSGNETHFEQAFLAAYLGYTLVEGGDLTVSDGRVWLRSVRRLERVDVILRRVDDDYCDSVELRPDSLLGVPGLTEVVRRGRVSVVNPLGAGILENPAFRAFLPAIARHFLGRELELPSIDSYWCGQPEALTRVLDEFDAMVIKPLHRAAGERPVFVSRLEAGEREALVARIRAHPERYVGERDARPASVPTLHSSGLVPRPAILRAFMIAHRGGYTVMPGGLARIAPDQNTGWVTNQAGGLSKDVWIQATEPVREQSLLQPVTAEAGDGAGLAEVRAALPPAAAENLFWMSRYAERAELGIRTLRVALRLQRSILEYAESVHPAVPRRMLAVVARVTATDPGSPEQAMLTLADSQRPGSIAFNLRAMLHAAGAVRDRLSPDILRVHHGVRQQLAAWRQRTGWTDRDGIADLDALVTLLAAVRGLQQDEVFPDHTWRFMALGRRLEQGVLLSELLAEALVEPLDTADEITLLSALLSVFESAGAYRRQFPGDVRVDRLLRLLLLNEDNPRSLNAVLRRLLEHMRGLPSDVPEDLLPQDVRLVLDARARVRLADPLSLADGGQRRQALEQLLAGVVGQLQAAAVHLADAYFTDPLGPQPLTALWPSGLKVSA